jgi:hypothetical protein
MADLLDLLEDNSDKSKAYRKTTTSFAGAIKKSSLFSGGDSKPSDSPYSNPMNTNPSIELFNERKAIGVDNDISAFAKEEKTYSNTANEFYSQSLGFNVYYYITFRKVILRWDLKRMM